jgi:uncharacterized protein (DUF1778 family)
MANATRRERMHFRLSAEDKTLFRTAAELKGQDMTDFVLSKARQAAEEVIEEQRDFVLPHDRFEAFSAALDRSPVEKPRLRRLLEEPTVLEEDDNEASVATTR